MMDDAQPSAAALTTRAARENGWQGFVRQRGALDTALREGRWPPHEADLCIRKGRESAVSGILEPEDDPESPLFFKRFRYRGAGLKIRRLLNRERASINWHISCALWHHGIGTPRPEGWLWHRGEAWFLCAAWPDASSLAALGRQVGDPEKLTVSSLDFVTEIAHMHAAGILHRDLKWGNLLLDPDGRRAIIDLDSARQSSAAVRERAAARDLARFVVSGLEAGLPEQWVDAVSERYNDARTSPMPHLHRHLRPAVNRISREHQRRYGRAAVTTPASTGSSIKK